VICGFNPTTEQLYIYEHDLWTPNRGTIEAAVTALLGNHYRPAHCRNVLDMIRY
jgi:hypothetical protein